MTRSLAILACASLVCGCASQQAARTSDSLFNSPTAELARELAPDLYENALTAWDQAEDARRGKDDLAAEELATEARLWIMAATVEAERVRLDQRRAELDLEVERWAKQLARDQQASAVVASDISRYEAQAVALREAERVAALGDARSASPETLSAVLTRVRLNVALAEALGATDAQLGPLRDRTEAIARRRPKSAQAAERLLLDSEALIGAMRAKWPSPRPGASTELVETAKVTGFEADRGGTGVVIRSERFFGSSGQLSQATVKRFAGLLSAFPHGPVACQVSVPEARSGVWARRAAQLVQALERVDGEGRVSASTIETESLRAGAVQCTFAAYREP
jgi:hypothetical protein